MTTAVAAARVEVLTAEVRVLQVGSRQVTLSVYRQLDVIALSGVIPFGRVRASSRPAGGGWEDWETIEVVGADRDGQLVASRLTRHGNRYSDPAGRWANSAEGERVWDELSSLPLIVLAGLR